MSRPLHSAPLVMNHCTLRCRCGKVYGLNEQDARRIVRRIQKRKGDTNSVRYYSCQFAGWHWTSQVNAYTRKEAA